MDYRFRPSPGGGAAAGQSLKMTYGLVSLCLSG
jgi:formiminotetrahydrofolate cyclodeaminase